jgi:hypothetical protein
MPTPPPADLMQESPPLSGDGEAPDGPGPETSAEPDAASDLAEGSEALPPAPGPDSPLCRFVDPAAEWYLDHERAGDRLAREGQTEAARAAWHRALALAPGADWIRAKIDVIETAAAALAAAPSPPDPDPDAVVTAETADRPEVTPALWLFMPFYTPADPPRAAELRACLRANLASDMIARIVLLMDDDTPLPEDDPRLMAIRLSARPSYLDWVQAALRLCPGRIAVLCNSDIQLDATIAGLAPIFAADPGGFVALSRFDLVAGAARPHPNPHWSQDLWAFLPDPARVPDPAQAARLAIPLGVPRCDNKIAYAFALGGARIYNPFPMIRALHVHETGLRYYDKTGDRQLVGGMAMVHPSADLTTPARVDLEIWIPHADSFAAPKISRALDHWDAQARIARAPRPAWIAHDADWQTPAVTERHAFQRMQAVLPGQPGRHDSLYLGFPFATLIDLTAHVGDRDPRRAALQGRLDALTRNPGPYRRVVTVSQHIRTAQFGDIFARAGVTDLFWSHAAVGQTHLPGHPGVRLHPFPLYPVQQVPRGPEDRDRPRRWLFSFVGARALKNYLTRSRDMIIDILGQDPRGKVVERGEWHYQKSVYEGQVLSSGGAAAAGGDAEAEFREILDQSVFTLCPSGSGPNTIRLWEAMVNGSIPVILADSWAAPGDAALWQAATLRLPETPAAIATLPHRLSALAADEARMAAMRNALDQLCRRYGPAGFVGDITALMGLPRQD